MCIRDRYAGFAMVLSIAIPFRKFYKLQDFITMKHVDMMCKVMLATGLIVGYGYVMEAFFGWYSANKYERLSLIHIWNSFLNLHLQDLTRGVSGNPDLRGKRQRSSIA